MATPDDIRKGVNRSEGDTFPLGVFGIQALFVAFLIGDFVSVLLGFASFIVLMALVYSNKLGKNILALGLALFWARVALEGAGWEWAIVTFIACWLLNLSAINILNNNI
ncbi:MAG: hypothetical protein H8E84_08315 [Flavobacteriales bacterium]|nr:hypothetical protein [Flavobacteriales bacterium]